MGVQRGDIRKMADGGVFDRGAVVLRKTKQS